MRPEPLFIKRCEQISQLAQSHDEAELLHLAAILRQVLVDQHSLMDTVNTHKVKIQFHAGVFNPKWMMMPVRAPVILSLEDGIDPETSPPGSYAVTLSKDEFLSHPVLFLKGEPATIKEIIKFASNISGGVHHDPNPRPEYQAMLKYSEQVGIGGLPGGVRQLKGIGRVVLRALQPLIDDVTNHPE